MHPYGVSWAMRNAVSNVVAFVILASGVLILPDNVLCLGPRNHCHLEVVVGTSCNNDLPGPHGSASEPSDGCPRGSKDFRLSVDSHRVDSSRLLATSSAMLFVASSLIEISHVSSSRLPLSGFQVARESLRSKIVLRC
jgi:hypothetical protein